MSMISIDTVFGAAGVVQNAWAGDTFEFLRADSTIKVALVSTVAGATATLKIGDAIVMQDVPVSAQAAMDLNAEDYKYVDAGRAGERLTLQLTAAGALTVRSLAIIA